MNISRQFTATWMNIIEWSPSTDNGQAEQMVGFAEIEICFFCLVQPQQQQEASNKKDDDHDRCRRKSCRPSWEASPHPFLCHGGISNP